LWFGLPPSNWLVKSFDHFAKESGTNVMSNSDMNPKQQTPILQASALHFGYANHKLFSNLSVSIPAGITLVRGGDGRGKSTLARLLAGALVAQSGQLHINGIDLQGQAAAYKSQVFFAEPRSDAFDQLSLPSYFDLQRSAYPGFDNAALAHLVDGLALEEQMHKQLFMLSTGSKRKVFLAAAFASGATVTLLDEPFAALDAASIAFILAWLHTAAELKTRAWVIADYVAPGELPLALTIDLGE
jgi:ABC-type multidrug transport system ATPase subunit